jgi:hypothetical protein
MTPTTSREAERQMMLDPMRWPCWPWLPVKRYSETPGQPPDCALIYADDTVDGQPVTLFEHPYKTKRPDRLETFANVDAMLDAGWVVD